MLLLHKYSKVALLTALLALGTLRAEAPPSEDGLHFAAHFGASFALNTAAYTFNRRALTLKKTDALILSAAETLFVGLVYKMLERGGSDGDFLKAQLYNASGILASTFIVIPLDCLP